MTVFGSGDYRYELVPQWPRMPRYWAFDLASDIAVNSRDEVHVFSRGAHPVTIWDTDGNFISSWGEGDFLMPHGIYIVANDNVWLVDSHYHIATEHTPDGKNIRTLGDKLKPSPGYARLPFNMPTGLTIAPNGEIFVSSGYGGYLVHKFSPQGELLLSWGRQGTGPGEFVNLHGIWVDEQSRVFVCDRENDRIQIFDDQGNFMEEWTDLRMPQNVCIRDGVVYVPESYDEDAGLSIWTLGGDLITRWRESEGTGHGALRGTHGICVDTQGSIYATDEERVQKFRRL